MKFREENAAMEELQSFSAAAERSGQPGVTEPNANAMPAFEGQMIKAVMQVQFNLLAESGTADKLATYTRNYYDALRERGFTKQESLNIVMNHYCPK